jgi:RNA polymerase sigma factor (TIGR02999 family)
MVTNPGEVSQLLGRIKDGDRSAEDRLFALLYSDLRRMAAHQLRRERSDHTLQPTALVHEVYVKVFGQTPHRDDLARLFMALVAQVMRRFLVDHAHQTGRETRRAAGILSPERLDRVFVYDTRHSDEFLAVHEALERLREWAPRQSQIVEMRYFEACQRRNHEYLTVSPRTVKRDWPWLDRGCTLSYPHDAKAWQNSKPCLKRSRKDLLKSGCRSCNASKLPWMILFFARSCGG